MKGQAAERIAARGGIAAVGRRHPSGALVRRADARHLVGAARRERQAAAIVDRAARQRARGREEPRVVLEAIAAVGLFGEARRRRHIVGVRDLHPAGAHDDRRGEDREDGAEERERPAHVRALARLTPRDGEHDTDCGAVGEHRRAAVAEKRRHDARQRNQPEQAARDDDSLHAHHEHNAGDEKCREVAWRAHRDPQAAPADERVERGDRRKPDPPELLAERGEHEVGVAFGNRGRAAEAGPAAPRAAGRERPQTVRDVIPARDAVVPGVRPDHHAVADRRRHARPVRRRETGEQQHDPEDDHSGSLPRDGVHAEEHERQHERRPEIALQKEEREHERHAGDDRLHVVPARQAEEPQP